MTCTKAASKIALSSTVKPTVIKAPLYLKIGHNIQEEKKKTKTAVLENLNIDKKSANCLSLHDSDS